MKTVVTMDREGRLTVPAATLDELGLTDETQFEVEVRRGTLVLRPKYVPPAEDAWAFTPEHLRLVERALQGEREGRVYQITEQELDERVPRSSR